MRCRFGFPQWSGGRRAGIQRVSAEALDLKNRHHYAHHVGDLKRRLREAIPHDRLRELHRLTPWRHFLTVGRLVASVLLCAWALAQTRWPALWIPAALLQGFNLLGFTVLLHEQVHDCIFRRRHPGWSRFLGWCYAVPAGMSALQFKIWHLDHHNELGSEEDDPKRAHLTPKINARWYKLLYCTPFLFWKYGRASAIEARTYEPAERATVRRERAAAVLVHLALVAGLWSAGGPWLALRVWAIPLLFAFPIAFVLSRLGQHYFIDPDNPAGWSTRIDGNPLWHWLFLWSNFHIEHHYFPRVPFYRLRELNAALRPFFRENGVRSRTYRELLWGWFVLNRAPHTNWEEAATSSGRRPTRPATRHA